LKNKKIKFINFLKNRKIEKLKKKLRANGAKIGENVRFFDYRNTIIDKQNPHMLEIGNNVCITSGVKILTHDYSYVVLSGIYGEILGGIDKTKIGNNVFIGMNSIILKGTNIGDNVVIGAGSIVSGNLESNSIYAGNPAKKIMTLDKFYEKKCNETLISVQRIFNNYYTKFNKIPPRSFFRDYISLYTSSEKELSECEKNLISRTGFYNFIIDNIHKHESKIKKFNNYNEMIEYLLYKYKNSK